MTLAKLFDKAWKAAEYRSWVPALLGKPDGAGGYTVAVTDRPGYAYVRVSNEGGQSVTIARNLAHVALRGNLAVRLRQEPGVGYVIIGEDSVYSASATASDPTNPYGVPYHTHRSDSGLAYEHEAKLFDQGRVFWNVAYTVYVNPFRYYYAGAWEYWAGGSISLGTYLPTTSNKWGWILVGLNPATNMLVAAAGSEYDSQAELTQGILSDITFTGYIPLAAIQANEADTSLNDYSRYYDASEWHGGLVNLFLDSEGNASNTTTAGNADGTSAFAARRDHVHGIADNAVTTAKITNANVTNAKLANMNQDTVKGRLSTGAGVPEDITIPDLAAAISSEINIGQLDDLTDVSVTTPTTNDVLIYAATEWANVSFASRLLLNESPVQMPFSEVPAMDGTNFKRFNENGSVSYPLGWSEVSAGNSYTDDPDGWWTIDGTEAIATIEYIFSTPFDFENDLASDEWKSYWLFPMHLHDGMSPSSVNYYIGLHADDSGNPNLNEFARLHIQRDQISELWQMRGQSKDGTTQTDGAWFELSRHFMQPFWLRIALKNDTNKTVRVYIGNNQWRRLHTLLYEDTVSSSVTWGEAVFRIRRDRPAGAATERDVLMLGGMDYSSDE